MADNLQTWGYNGEGELGLGDYGNRLTPTAVALDLKAVDAGVEHGLGIRTDGTLWGWGLNAGYAISSSYPYTVPAPVQIGAAADWQTINAGQNFSHGIKTDGSLWGWGSNGSTGCVGNGSTVAVPNPLQIGSSTWRSVSARTFHALAIRSDGTLWGWGAGTTGALGDGLSSTYTVPTQIGVAADWASVSAGGSYGNLIGGFSLAIKADGSLWACGVNSNGELGLGDTSPRTSWTRVGTDTNWAAAASGGNFSLALKTDGSLWGWGANNSHQLGLGDTTDRLVPTRIGTASDWTTVACEEAGGRAIKTDGSLWVWGDGSNGSLGLGDTSGRSTPTQLGTESWTAVTAGYWFTFGLLHIIPPTFWTNLFGQREAA